MALTRKLLESMGIEADKVTSIIEAHVETVDGLKDKIKRFEEEAGKNEETKTELVKAKKDLAAANEELSKLKENGGDWQEKYEKEHKDFEAYKTEQDEKAKKEAKATAYKQLLLDAGVSEKRIATVMRVADLEKIEMDEEGKIKDSEKHTESIKEEWADFITSSETHGAGTHNPPGGNSGGSKSMEELSKLSMEEYIKARQGN